MLDTCENNLELQVLGFACTPIFLSLRENSQTGCGWIMVHIRYFLNKRVEHFVVSLLHVTALLGICHIAFYICIELNLRFTLMHFVRFYYLTIYLYVFIATCIINVCLFKKDKEKNAKTDACKNYYTRKNVALMY